MYVFWNFLESEIRIKFLRDFWNMMDNEFRSDMLG